MAAIAKEAGGGGKTSAGKQTPAFRRSQKGTRRRRGRDLRRVNGERRSTLRAYDDPALLVK